MLGFFDQEVWKTSPENSARFSAAEATAFFDIDRIEFVAVASGPPASLSIADIQPRRGTRGTIVTLTGSGFAVPAEENVVLFDVARAEVVDGSETVLRVVAASTGNAVVTVQRPGGSKAVAPATFEIVRRAREIVLVNGDGQSIGIGATSVPLTVQLRNRVGGGVPGQSVRFQVVSGDATLTMDEVVTGDDGLASTSVVAGNTPGAVSVEARAGRLLPVIFTMTVN